NLKSAKTEPAILAASHPKKVMKTAKIEPVIPAASHPKKVQQKGPVPASSASAVPEKAQRSAAPLDELAMAGYTAQRISVDFYKIDLHNVFRLIGAVSGRNIVVDEGVQGTLTLALNNVPWDFVLDVILNLKDLQKEDRFNTIVISPKGKNYTWPKRPADNLAIAPNGSVLKQEAISIKKKQETPQEIIDAKKLILRGNEQYRAGRYDAALPLYEEAFAKWPKNKQLAGRIAALALVQLGQNAKAVHYAKAALELDPHNSEAALQAAIGLANMKKTDEARKYFDLAVAGSRPNGEALLSYAAFCENNGHLKTALALLAKHEEIQGDTLESMVAKARLLDKLGRSKEANEEYRAVLLSGFKIPPDLKRYIQGRMAVANR
ncbi:MAG: secretin and TonB N-terminal domain-containing protein, partial [Deltaproteobacteria bacterium]